MERSAIVPTRPIVSTALLFSPCSDVNMERYAEEYDVAIVGGGPDILFF